MSGAPVPLLIDGDPFEDIDGFLYDNSEALSKLDKEMLDDLIHGRRSSAYIGGGHLPVWFVCTADEQKR